MYKTQYKKALVDHSQTPETLLPKSKAAYDEVVDLETSLSELNKSLKHASEDEVASIQTSIETLEESLQALDSDLCKKISKNQFYINNSARLAAGRAAAKNKTNAAPAKPAEVKPKKADTIPKVELPKKESKPAAPIIAAPENKVVPPEIEKNDGKKDEKKDDKKDDKNGKTSTGEIVGWTVGALVTGALVFFGLPIAALNKEAFSFRIRR